MTTTFSLHHTWTLAPDWTITPAIGGTVTGFGGGGFDATPRWGTVTVGWRF